VKKKKMKRTIGLIGVVAIAMALTIAFSGVALASQPVKPTKETEIIDITTDITCSGTVVESQGLSLEIGSKNLLDNPSLKDGEIYGGIKYDEKMIGLSGDTEFDKCFGVDTGTTPNLNVHKQIGYKQGFLGSLSHHEQLGMKVIAAGKTTTKDESVLPEEEEEWKKKLCPFVDTTTTKVPGSCEEVHAYSEMVVTNVEATAETKVGITGVSGNPVNLNYQIQAAGVGLVVAGVDIYVADGRGGKDSALGSRMMYKEKSIAYGNVTFHKKIGYVSILPKP
jgi:hypothetical protein